LIDFEIIENFFGSFGLVFINEASSFMKLRIIIMIILMILSRKKILEVLRFLIITSHEGTGLQGIAIYFERQFVFVQS